MLMASDLERYVFTRPIVADGVRATPEQQARAFVRFARMSGQKRYSDLARFLVEEPLEVVGRTDPHYPTHRLADRMLQKARKAGLARFNGKEWEIANAD